MENQDKTILAIETSCDETAAAVVKNGREVLSNVIHSQIDIHSIYGGVVPEIAARSHIEQITQIVDKALTDADMTLEDITHIAVTNGPGLVGPLLVGVSYAKALAMAADIPLMAVNHMHGHIAANYIDMEDNLGVKPPFLCLVVSGGHTNLVLAEEYNNYQMLGQTRDDAAGEAFDKISRALGLGYPGGPAIQQAADKGNPNSMEFPKAKVSGSKYDFSFSGVKSAVLNYLNEADMAARSVNVNDVAAAFQQSVVEALVDKTKLAIEEYFPTVLCVAGGVAANLALRNALSDLCKDKNIKFHCPDISLCTDNAAMIAASAYFISDENAANMALNAYPSMEF